MTFAVSIKIHDGVVLASDSAATIPIDLGSDQRAAANVYENAEKLFNLRKGLPIGMVVWGLGGIGDRSMPTLVRDLRRELSPNGKRALNEMDYTLEGVAEHARAFLHDERYSDVYGPLPADRRPAYGFIVAGFSSGSEKPEEWLFEVAGGQAKGPVQMHAEQSGTITASGDPEAVTRLLTGRGSELGKVLHRDLGVPEDQVEGALRVIDSRLATPLAHPAMPIQDAIDLAEFLVDLTIRWYRFRPGAPVVGGPIEIAAVTKHEGFRWVRRKHFFDPALNRDREDR